MERGRGLSPRVRGNLLPVFISAAGQRSIPACAGEPLSRRRMKNGGTVYPRVCGGTCQTTRMARGDKGLSPRVRGNRCGLIEHTNREGSIPACAGEPILEYHYRHPQTVYPRVCGGTSRALRVCASRRGLSPRVRGNPGVVPRLTIPRRSIPACAGEPRRRSPSYDPPPVYPRVCGGTVVPKSVARLVGGLSPRVRGNRSPRAQGMGSRRSIPACAGEPLQEA